MSQFKKIKKNVNKFVLAEHDDEQEEKEVAKNLSNNNIQIDSYIEPDLMQHGENEHKFVKCFVLFYFQ